MADELAVVIEDSDARFIIAENQEQIDKILEFKARCPLVEKVIYDDPRGMLHYRQSFLHDYKQFLKIGKQFDNENEIFMIKQWRKERAVM